MTTLAQAKADGALRPRMPQRIITLPTSAFSDEWKKKPQADVAAGLRLVSERSLRAILAEAVRISEGFYEGREPGSCLDEEAREEEFDRALRRMVVARALTDPNDIERPYFAEVLDDGSIGGTPDDTCGSAMTMGGIDRVWDEYIVMLAGCGSRNVPIRDEDLESLGQMLRPEVIGAMPAGIQAETRKLLSEIRERLAPIAEAMDGAAYVFRAKD